MYPDLFDSSAGRILLAPDKFKGSLTAAEAAARLAAGLRRAVPGIATVAVPVADGGEGTVDAVVEAAGFRALRAMVSGPTGEPVAASFAIRGQTAVIESAQACGLSRLPAGPQGPKPAPLTATSYGAGELVGAALNAGCTRIILGLGGSACTDGGAGLVQALGARLADSDGIELRRGVGGAALSGAASVDISTLRERIDGIEIIVACDVDNPLLGSSGAAAVYGPQKGASRSDVATLDAALAVWSRAVAEAIGTEKYATHPGAGAAGGIGFAALALLGAQLRPGIELMLELAGFEEKARDCRLVITGEGSLDLQSLRGKAPAGVANAANRLALPVIAVSGICELNADELRDAGFTDAYELVDIEPDIERCIQHAGPLLELLGERIGRKHLR